MRDCGECYVCCVVLGVAELKKYPDQVCKKLNGSDPCKRCTIYDKRPQACSSYNCGWRLGFFEEEDRPDKSGFLATPYTTQWAVYALDTTKCGTGFDQGGRLQKAIQELLAQVSLEPSGPQEVAITYSKLGKCVLFRGGMMYEGRVAPNKKGQYESLSYQCHKEPFGKYVVKDKSS